MTELGAITAYVLFGVWLWWGRALWNSWHHPSKLTSWDSFWPLVMGWPIYWLLTPALRRLRATFRRKDEEE